MVDKYKKAPGRPRSFDMDEALGKAMKVFWAQGYDGTSMDDLEAAMGIGRPSLYRAFGDKRTLFMKSLDHYAQTVAGLCLSQMFEHDDIGQAMLAMYQQSVSNVTANGAGCMVGCVATSVADPEVKDFLRLSSEKMEKALEERLRQAVAGGQLPEDFPVKYRARRAFDALISLGFRGRSGTDKATLLQDAADTAKLVLS